VGALFTNRSVSADGAGANRAYGIDGTFAFLENFQVNTYWARTENDGLPRPAGARDTSYRAQLDYTGDRYGLQVERLAIGERFNPEVGFVRRRDMVRSFAELRFSPRPADASVVRKFHHQGSVEYIEDGAGRLESRERTAEFAVEFQSNDRAAVRYTNAYEFFPVESEIGGVLLPIGEYRFDTLRLQYNIGQQRLVSASLVAEYGTFYNGDKRTLSISRGRIPLTNQLSVEPVYTVNKVSLIQGRFTQHLTGSRVTFTATPLMFFSALLQYNSQAQAVSANVRVRWEYQPGSELFVVYNEERDTLARSFPSLSNRAFIVKINRLFRF
jgi:hypothetical protein